MAQKNTDIWIEAVENDVNIEVMIEDHDDIDVAMEGTILFNPAVDMEPIIKDYLEHENDLTTLYVGSSVIVPVSYTHTQGIGAMTWSINHGLGRKGVVIQCFDNNSKEVKAEVQHIDTDNAVVYFGMVVSGTAECR